MRRVKTAHGFQRTLHPYRFMDHYRVLLHPLEKPHVATHLKKRVKDCLVVVVDPAQWGRLGAIDYDDEAFITLLTHESREDFWEGLKYSSREAHVLASAELLEDPHQPGQLSLWARLQIERMSEEELKNVLAEFDRSQHVALVSHAAQTHNLRINPVQYAALSHVFVQEVFLRYLSFRAETPERFRHDHALMRYLLSRYPYALGPLRQFILEAPGSFSGFVDNWEAAEKQGNENHFLANHFPSLSFLNRDAPLSESPFIHISGLPANWKDVPPHMRIFMNDLIQRWASLRQTIPEIEWLERTESLIPAFLGKDVKDQQRTLPIALDPHIRKPHIRYAETDAWILQYLNDPKRNGMQSSVMTRLVDQTIEFLIHDTGHGAHANRWIQFTKDPNDPLRRYLNTIREETPELFKFIIGTIIGDLVAELFRFSTDSHSRNPNAHTQNYLDYWVNRVGAPGWETMIEPIEGKLNLAKDIVRYKLSGMHYGDFEAILAELQYDLLDADTFVVLAGLIGMIRQHLTQYTYRPPTRNALPVAA